MVKAGYLGPKVLGGSISVQLLLLLLSVFFVFFLIGE